MTISPIKIIGAGLAGCEAAWQLADKGFFVDLYEMRPKKKTAAHKTDKFCELVCSNSFRSSDDQRNAVGQLKWELRSAKSLIMETADKHAVPAGGALAIDRVEFSNEITKKINCHPLIKIKQEEFSNLSSENGTTIIATGPLTSNTLAEELKAITRSENLSFFDAIAPIIYVEDVDLNKAWFQSRYDKGDTDLEKKAYLNCPMNKQEYEAFVSSLLTAPKMEFKKWEKETPYFQACLPIEVMASSGIDTLRFGPMKPVGLRNPHDQDRRPHAVVQLRPDNLSQTLYNMVGFQTKMTYSSQISVFQKIPGLEKITFARLGGIHRNTFINAPEILSSDLSLKDSSNIYFAGQITGVEGYVESTAIGLLVALFLVNKMTGKPQSSPPSTTALGSLHKYLLTKDKKDLYQPMNVNFGLFKELDYKHTKKMPKDNRKLAYTKRAKLDFTNWFMSKTKSP
ncbi:MAG: methylenetetrahydrofolate--tRNA-(uracil(54)-C(5))-methyltransferase (FADH(2)-oxidizing) TrmFO [Paracoccaceae bacterium]